MTVPEVADILNLLRNPCRLKLSRNAIPTLNRRDDLQRPLSVDADSFLQEQKHSSNPLPVFLFC